MPGESVSEASASKDEPSVLRSVSVNLAPPLRSSPKLRSFRGASTTQPFSRATSSTQTCTSSTLVPTLGAPWTTAEEEFMLGPLPAPRSSLGAEGAEAGGSGRETGGEGEVELERLGEAGPAEEGEESGSSIEGRERKCDEGMGNGCPEGLLAQQSRGWERAQRVGRCLRVIGYIILGIVGLGCIALVASFVGPLILKKVVLPLMAWEQQHLSRPLLACVAVLTMAVFPVFMLPTGPSMWLLGIVFDYTWGFCLIMVGAFFGQTLPYLMGHRLMHHRVQAWLAANARLTAILRLADSGGWVDQFKTTLFLRMSPFPYLLFNYAITATRIKYGPYICASMVAMIPETFIAIYCGKLIQKVAQAHSGGVLHRPMTPVEVVYEVLGLCVASSVVIVGMVHGHRAFKELEEQERRGREEQDRMVLTEEGHAEVESGERRGVGREGDLEAHRCLSDSVIHISSPLHPHALSPQEERSFSLSKHTWHKAGVLQGDVSQGQCAQVLLCEGETESCAEMRGSRKTASLSREDLCGISHESVGNSQIWPSLKGSNHTQEELQARNAFLA